MNPPAGLSIDRRAVRRLVAAVRRNVDDGTVPAAQVAVAFRGDVILDETFGDATPESRFMVFSATKPLTAMAIAALVGDGALNLNDHVADLIADFGQHGKQTIRVQDLLLHTAGLASAPTPASTWLQPDDIARTIRNWSTASPPGSVYEYHPLSGHFVLGALAEHITGRPLVDIVADRITSPAGVPRLLGVPDEIEPIRPVGDVPSGRVALLTELARPDVRLRGVPAAGGVARAVDLANWYQGVVRGDLDVAPRTLRHFRDDVVLQLADSTTSMPANRTLAFVQAGADGWTAARGFGSLVSPTAFGHHGTGGQIAWADPATGLSFAHCTNGLDLDPIRSLVRLTTLSTLAAACTSS